MPATTPPIQPPPSFPTHARKVVHALRAAFADALVAINIDPSEPQSISREMGLNKNLAWKISKIIQTADPAVVLQQMPGTAGINIFRRAVQRTEPDSTILTAIDEAVEDYNRLIEVHSGDRATLDMMGSMLSPSGDPQRDEHHRKLIFQGASYVWGVQARVALKLGVVGPSSRQHMLDFASINALIGFRRIRPDVPWVMASRHANFDDGSNMPGSPMEPIDLRYKEPSKAPLMADFCSQPLPELRRRANRIGATFELVEGPVGKTGAITCTVGMIQRNIPAYGDSDDDMGRHLATCDTPCELLVLDLLIHRDFSFAIPPESALCSLAAVSSPPPLADRKYLPLNEPLVDLGTNHAPAVTPEVPHYAQMLQAIFERTGWNASEFHGFRMKIAYPAFPTAIELRYPLPVRPADV